MTDPQLQRLISALGDSDAYHVLEIPRSSDDETIRGAYRQLRTKWHPDRWPPGYCTPAEIAMASTRFVAVQAAWQILTEHRAEYHRHLETSTPGRPHPPREPTSPPLPFPATSPPTAGPGHPPNRPAAPQHRPRRHWRMSHKSVVALLAAFALLAVIAGALYIRGSDPTAETIPVAGRPADVAVDPGTHLVYVTIPDKDTVSVIDPATHTATAGIALPYHPMGIAIDPGTHTGYVVGGTPNFAWEHDNPATLSMIDLATGTVTATIPLDFPPRSVTVDPDTHLVYVPNDNDQTIAVIDPDTRTITTAIGPLGGGCGGVAIDPGTHTAYTVKSVIDTLTRTVTARIPGPSCFGPGSSGPIIAVDTTTHIVYIATGGDTRDDSTVLVIAPATHTITATIQIGYGAHGIAIDPTSHTAYVAHSGSDTVSIIDTTTRTVTRTIHVGAYPQNVAIDPATHTAYITDGETTAVSTITHQPSK